MNYASKITLLLSCFIISACAGGASNAPVNTSTQDSARPALETKSIDATMREKLAVAEATGDADTVINILGQLNATTPDDPILATRYARALREADQINAAEKILLPFTDVEKPNVEAITEIAMLKLTKAEYEAAKDYALKSTAIAPKNARGYLALGTAQDALGDHQNAEISFRQGLKYWKGDPSPILNNLALNLASQGHLEQSLSLLQRAVKISPKRMELERNRRIIATLLETSNPTAPTPTPKPEIKIPESVQN